MTMSCRLFVCSFVCHLYHLLMAAGACRVGLSVALTCCVLKDLCSLFVNNCCLCQVQNLLSSGEHRVQNMCAWMMVLKMQLICAFISSVQVCSEVSFDCVTAVKATVLDGELIVGTQCCEAVPVCSTPAVLRG